MDEYTLPDSGLDAAPLLPDELRRRISGPAAEAVEVREQMESIDRLFCDVDIALQRLGHRPGAPAAELSRLVRTEMMATLFVKAADWPPADTGVAPPSVRSTTSAP